MRLQVWPVENIENILWAMQAMHIAKTALLNERRQAGSQSPYDQGFNAAFANINQILNSRPTASRIWSSEQLLDALQAAQTLRHRARSQNEHSSSANHRGFDEGFEVALTCMATAFGISLFSTSTLPSSQKSGARSNQTYWLHGDVKSIFSALDQVCRSITASAGDPLRLEPFMNGFETALMHLAKLFGFNLVPGPGSATRVDDRYWPRHELYQKLRIVLRTMPGSADLAKFDPKARDYWKGFETCLIGIETALGKDL